MTKSREDRIQERREQLKSPRAAAVAGIIFAVLFTISLVLVRLALPDISAADAGANELTQHAGSLGFALTLIPFAGIAFLWFMGVIRDRLGDYEDQFFSTVFFGSGLLFLAMIFVSAAIAAGMIASYAALDETLIQSGVLRFGREITFTITNIYAIRMAGVFMMSLATLWNRTRVMPRLFVILTYILALLMLVAINLTVWLALVFPIWVFVISVYILFITMRRNEATADSALRASES